MLIANKRTHQRTPADVYVGRPSPLGNPFFIGKHGDRDLVVEYYGRWLLAKIRENDHAVLHALYSLKPDSVLVCWCAPERCHAEMIIRAHTWLLAQTNAPAA